MTNSEMLKRLANSQLDHVLLALRDGDRAFNLRDVLDPWWCYERGGVFVGRRQSGGFFARQFNNPCPFKQAEHLRRFDWLSTRAREVLNLGETARKGANQPLPFRLLVDHSVPLAVIGRELWHKPESWDVGKLRDFLHENFKRAVISHADDQALNSHGLKNDMPRGALDGDPFARYRAAGIA